jgi:hypothetical protein
MKLSLRKANALQLLIQEQINEPFAGTVTLSKYDETGQTFEAAAKVLDETITRKFELIEVLYSIRKKVGKASSEHGVAALLTDLAETEKLILFHKQLASTTQFAIPVPQIKVILKDLEEQAKTANSYARKDAVTVGLLSKETVATYKNTINTLRKQKQAISDKLLHLNVSTEIELGAKETDVLNKYEIL